MGERVPGRFVSRLAALQAIDVNPNLAWQVTPNSASASASSAASRRSSWSQHLPQYNPFTQTAADIASVKLDGGLDNTGYGFDLGLLHKVNNSFSWGLTYRSAITVDYAGDAS